MKSRAKFVALTAARILLTAAAWAAAAAVLYKFEYFSQITQVDNVTGALPIAFALIFAGGCTALAWMKYDRKSAPVAIATAAFVILSALLYPNALRGNWWIDYGYSTEGDSPDIGVYEPFMEGSLAASLNEEPTLRLSGELPVMDGAIALYPLYAAFAQAVYDESDYSKDVVRCLNTKVAYEDIISGEADVVFCAAPSASQRAAAEAAGAELVLTPIAREAFVFIVGASNPVEGLTTQQIYNIYTGKTAKWRTLGWTEGGDIIAFRRPEVSGSESGLNNLVMKGRPVLVPQPLPSGAIDGSNSLMKQVSVTYNGVQPALGYSYRYFAQSMYPNPDTKLLSVDGHAPTDDNIMNGNYPFVAEVYAVTNGKPEGAVAELIEWILSPQGQYLVEQTGYAPIK